MQILVVVTYVTDVEVAMAVSALFKTADARWCVLLLC